MQIVQDPVLVVMQIVTNDPLSIYQCILSSANLFQYLPVMQSFYCVRHETLMYLAITHFARELRTVANFFLDV